MQKEVTSHKRGSHDLTIHATDAIEFNAHHAYELTDSNGHPVGTINYQKGRRENGINGFRNEEVLATIIDRIKCFQSGATTASEQNAEALMHLENAMTCLKSKSAQAAERHSETA